RDDVGERGAREAAQLLAVGVERVAGKVEAEALLLVHQALALAPHRGRREREGLGAAALGAAEEAGLGGELLALLRDVDGVAERGEQARAIGLEGIERPRLDERLHRAAVDDAPVDAAAEVRQPREL